MKKETQVLEEVEEVGKMYKDREIQVSIANVSTKPS